MALWVAKFFLPVVLPPEHYFSDPVSYYSAIEAQGVVVNASAQAPGAPMEITVEKADVLHVHSGALPMSTVFAPMGGFVSYVQGELVLRVSGSDFGDLVKPAGGMRPNQIVFGSLDPTTIEQAIAKQIAKLSLVVLTESWTEGGGTGTAPLQPALEAAMVQRFMAGTASIFVSSGTPLGQGSPTAGVNGPVVRLTMQTFFDPWGPAPAVSVPPEDLIDNALDVLQLPKFGGHPLVKALNAVINIHFLSQFLIWTTTPSITCRWRIPMSRSSPARLFRPRWPILSPPCRWRPLKRTAPAAST